MRPKCQIPAIVVAIILFVVSITRAQTTRPAGAAPAKPADEKTFTAAIAAYDKSAKGMIDLDYDTLARTLADNRRPVVPPESHKDAAIVAAARNSPDARGSRPTTATGRCPLNSPTSASTCAAATDRSSASSAVMSWFASPRTPSVPKSRATWV